MEHPRKPPSNTKSQVTLQYNLSDFLYVRALYVAYYVRRIPDGYVTLQRVRIKLYTHVP